MEETFQRFKDSVEWWLEGENLDWYAKKQCQFGSEIGSSPRGRCEIACAQV
jgi:hypothetical protein